MTTATTIPTTGGSGERSAVAAAGRAVTKAYGIDETRVLALDAVDVDIARGRFTAIMGPSGSGKSTLMHCLAGLDTVTEGQIWIGDTEITGLKDKKLTQLRRDKVGFIFQSFNLLPTLNAAENITLPMDIAGRKVDSEWMERVVETVGLGGRLKHRPNQLSGGQQQRVAVARALVTQPALLLADEPTGNLDTASSADVLGLLDELSAAGSTIVLITHEADVARAAGSVVHIRDGRLETSSGGPR